MDLAKTTYSTLLLNSFIGNVLKFDPAIKKIIVFYHVSLYAIVKFYNVVSQVFPTNAPGTTIATCAICSHIK